MKLQHLIVLTIAVMGIADSFPVMAQQLPSLPAPPGTKVQPSTRASPAQVPAQVPGGGPAAGTIFTELPVKSLASPVVGKEFIGFYNSANQPISFVVASEGATQKVDLVSHEILTLRYPGAATVTGTIGTGDIDATENFARGTIYMIVAQGGRWIFRPF